MCRSIVCAGLIGSVLFCFAQGQKSDRIAGSMTNVAKNGAPTLRIATLTPRGEAQSTSLQVGGLYGPVRCTNSNIYLRVIGSDLMPLTSAVSRVSLDGKNLAKFEVRAIANEFPGRTVIVPQYAVDDYGRVHFIARVIAESRSDLDKLFIATFANSGNLLRRVKLNRMLWPYAFAALKSGDFLISGLEGYEPPRASTGTPPKSITAIFDSDGRLRRNLTSARDDEEISKKKSGEQLINSTIQEGDALVGPDGFVYLLKAGASPRVQVLAEDGSLVRELQLVPPLPNATGRDLTLSEGRIGLSFHPGGVDSVSGQKRRGVIYAIYDATSGEPLQYLQRAEGLKGLFACFERDEFTFLEVKTNNFGLVRASVTN